MAPWDGVQCVIVISLSYPLTVLQTLFKTFKNVFEGTAA